MAYRITQNPILAEFCAVLNSKTNLLAEGVMLDIKAFNPTVLYIMDSNCNE